jgi:hypothetical protein
MIIWSLPIQGSSRGVASLDSRTWVIQPIMYYKRSTMKYSSDSGVNYRVHLVKYRLS